MEEKKHWGQHGPECFACKIQSVQVDPRAMPSRRNNNPGVGTRYNTWENSIPTDSRNMPVLGRDLEPISAKKYAQHRHRIDETKRHPESVKDN